MKAAVLEAYHNPLLIRELENPDPEPNEVTIEVKACGLCSTDVHISEGKIPSIKLPLIPGHEFAGVVTKTGAAVTDFSIGDRVIVCVDASCGRCDFCLRGETTRCSDLSPHRL